MMSRSLDTELKSKLLQAVQTLTKELTCIVQDGREAFKASGDISDFVKSHGSNHFHGLTLIYPVQVYVACLKTAGVATRKDLEALWTRLYSDGTVREAVEELLAVEENWTSFVSELDQEMSDYEEKTAFGAIKVGEYFPLDLPLIDTTTGDNLLLKSVLEKSPYTLCILRKHYV